MVCDCKPYDIPAGTQYRRTELEPSRLPALRAAQGIDSMEQAGRRGDGWICCCGRHNRLSDTQCRMCGRQSAMQPPTEAAVQSYCGKCGARLKADAQFCYSCGARQG